MTVEPPTLQKPISDIVKQRVKKVGRGWQYQPSGRLYTGRGSYKKATKQGFAILASARKLVENMVETG